MSRRLFAPEVIQTSGMDCGPASLKSVIGGFGVHVSYGRLREACQTDVDGTSIDVMEEVAQQLGMDAEQTMLPLDHLLLPEVDALPGILVVRNPDGNVHFVVAWRRHGPIVQVMDPASGRRWMRVEELLANTFTHAMPVPAEAWREFAGGDGFLGALRARMKRLGVLATGEALVAQAVAEPSWRSLATLDAATRMTDALVASGGVDAGAEAARLLAATFAEAMRELAEARVDTCIPRVFWNAAPLAPAEDGEVRVLLRGAVIVRIRGKAAAHAEGQDGEPRILSPELAAALSEAPVHPLREAIAMLRGDGLLTPALLVGATLAAALSAAVEAIVLRGLLGVTIHLGSWEHRAAAMIALVVLFAASLALELPLMAQAMRMGRRLEMRFRMALFAKIPRLSDRYFSSRPTSDMSHRAHAIHTVRQLPLLGLRILRSTADIVVASLGIVWMNPRSAPFVLVATLTCLVVPIVTQRALTERDARIRAFDGALTRFYLDALLGLVALRTHGAGRSLRREHEGMLGELRRAFLGLLELSTTVEALTAFVSAATTVGLLGQYLARGGEPAGSLLLVYWALSIPLVGADLAAAMRQYPEQRNVTERLLEPLGALEDTEDAQGAVTAAPPERAHAAELRFVDVEVRAAGKTILEELDLAIGAGEHVAIVGPSGAGKSSLCALLLGWHRASRGEVLVDGVSLRGEQLDALRGETAWVDPAIQLWNRSLLENIEYGATDAAATLPQVLEAADVVRLLEHLPNGLQTRLGDGGALVSGGEGQRVRLARAMLRADSRLVVLDEPFRGLDREKRHLLLGRARSIWANSTLLCVTHDVGETLDFGRVILIEDGRIVEDASPRALAADPRSRYRALLDAERSVRDGLWRGAAWRRFELRAGVLAERHDGGLE